MQMTDISAEEKKKLVESARLARINAYAPYSGYQVGAALLTTKGNLYTGCNVENAALSITLHAEMSAIAAAVSAGEREFLALAVVTAGARPAFPCALCRQALIEFNRGEMLIIAAGGAGRAEETTLSSLYPFPFSPCHLQEDK